MKPLTVPPCGVSATRSTRSKYPCFWNLVSAASPSSMKYFHASFSLPATGRSHPMNNNAVAMAVSSSSVPTPARDEGNAKIAAGYGNRQDDVRSPVADIVQTPHGELPVRQEQVGVPPQPAGSAVHA